MFSRLRVAGLLAVILLLNAGCARMQTTPVPADMPPDAIPRAARLTEDGDLPLILRGVDRQSVPFRVYMPGLLTHHYLLPPGRHLLWAQTLADWLYPLLPLPLGDIRCYILEAELEAGRTYRLKEAPLQREALLVAEKAPEAVVARGPLVDRFHAGTRTCAWP